MESTEDSGNVNFTLTGMITRPLHFNGCNKNEDLICSLDNLTVVFTTHSFQLSYSGP